VVAGELAFGPVGSCSFAADKLGPRDTPHVETAIPQLKIPPTNRLLLRRMTRPSLGLKVSAVRQFPLPPPRQHAGTFGSTNGVPLRLPEVAPLL
jgi:hypothetical protein